MKYNKKYLFAACAALLLADSLQQVGIPHNDLQYAVHVS